MIFSEIVFISLKKKPLNFSNLLKASYSLVKTLKIRSNCEKSDFSPIPLRYFAITFLILGV